MLISTGENILKFLENYLNAGVFINDKITM